MNPLYRLPRIVALRVAVAGLMSLGVLAGCGQTGPLFMPKIPPASTKAAPAPAVVPVAPTTLPEEK